jgi:hypothetical protein
MVRMARPFGTIFDRGPIRKMSQLDFDEFDYRERKRSPLDWSNPQPQNATDCKVIVNGEAKEYSIHLKVASRSSEFFFNIARGRFQPAEKLPTIISFILHLQTAMSS